MFLILHFLPPQAFPKSAYHLCLFNKSVQLDEPNIDEWWQQTLPSSASEVSSQLWGKTLRAETVVGRLRRSQHWILTFLCCPAIHSSQKRQPVGKGAEYGLIKCQKRSPLKGGLAHCLLHCGAQTLPSALLSPLRKSYHQSSVGFPEKHLPAPTPQPGSRVTENARTDPKSKLHIVRAESQITPFHLSI